MADQMTLNILAKEIHIGDYEIIFIDGGQTAGNSWWMYGPLGDGFQMNYEVMRSFEDHIGEFFEDTM